MPHRLRFALLVLPLLLLLGVLVDTAPHRLPQGKLTGVFTKVELPELSWRALWDGKFQTGFDNWLEQQLSLKAAMVRTDNTVNLLLFRDISAHTQTPIVLGRQHTLFELDYIDNRNAIAEFTGKMPFRSGYTLPESLRRFGRAARAFRALGIDFVVVFYPNKAEILRSRVPERYWLPAANQRAAAGYHRLLDGLRAEGVPVVDGEAIYRTLAERDPRFPLYNSGGTHWTDVGTCEVMKQVVQLMPSAVGSALRCQWGPAHVAQNTDADLAELINVWDNSRFLDMIPSLNPELSPPLRDGPRDAMLIGSSYTEHLERVLREAGVINKAKRISYYRHDKHASHIAWNRELAKRKLFVVEQWTWQYLTVNSTEFVDDLETQSSDFAAALREVDAEAAASAP